jgi:hypothetical protein
VALYASSRPTLPHTLVQDVINYLNRKRFFIIYVDARSRPVREADLEIRVADLKSRMADLESRMTAFWPSR